MVWTSRKDNLRFPRFEHYMLDEFSRRVIANKSLFENFIKWSDLTKQDASACLKFRRDPELRVASNFKCEQLKDGNYRKRMGLTVSDKLILIAEDLVQNFEETEEARVRNKSRDTTAHIYVALEATVLHELVHWAYLDKGKVEPGDREVGHEFEEEAYGKTIGRGFKLACP